MKMTDEQVIQELGMTPTSKGANIAAPVSVASKKLTDQDVMDKLGLKPKLSDAKSQYDHENDLYKTADLVNSFGSGVAQNISDLGQGALWAAHKVTQMMPGEKFIEPIVQKEEQEIKKVPLTKRLMQPSKGAVSKTAETIGEFADPIQYMMPGLEAEGLVSTASGMLKRAGVRSLEGGATAGAYGAALTPGARKEGAFSGLAIGSALGAALGLPSSAVSGLLSHIAERAKKSGELIRSPEQVEKLMKKLPTKAMESMNFGDLVNHPQLSSFFHDTLANLPFSGARNFGDNILSASRNLGKNIVAQLKGDHNLGELNTGLLEKTKNKYQALKSVSNKLFENLKKKGTDVNIMPTETGKVALKYLNKHKNKNLAYTLDGDVLNLVKQAAGVAKKGNPLSFNDLMENKQFYSKAAHEKFIKQEDRMAMVMSEITDASRKDLEKGAKDSKNQSLILGLNKANKFYKENIGPFNSKSVRELLRTDIPKKNQDVSKILMSGENQKIIKHFTESEKALLGMQIMKRGVEPKVLDEEFANPTKLLKYYDTLENKKDFLLSPEMQNKFEQLRALNEASREPALKEKKSATGYRKVGELLRSLPAFLSGGAVFSPEYRTPLILGAAGIAGIGKGLTKTLTSPWLRKAYIKGELPKALMMKTRKQITPKMATLLAAQNLRKRKK